MAYQRIILQSGFTNLMAYVSEAKLHRIFPRFMPVPKVAASNSSKFSSFDAASIQPRTSPVKFAGSPCTDPPG